jgi:energy-coupling factor transporter ATP-binding protein EcfA2
MSYGSCAREGCQIASTEKCVEGFDPPSTCPYVSTSASSPADATSAGVAAFVDLPNGESLTEAQASEVTRQGITRVVVLAGPSGSGKTTILTSLFEAFLEAPFGNLLFAGSRTLVGFERRCHDARTASGRPVPHTVHTQVEATDFLHLRLASPSDSLLGPQNLLLSDVSGERFRALRDSTDAVRRMSMLRRTDDLCIVLDGEKLADMSQRHSAQTDARMLLRCIVEEGVLSSSCKIEIVFSKWDLVAANPAQEALMSFIDETKQVVQKVAGSALEVQFFQVAARPENRKVPFAFGIPTLLRSWVKEPSLPERPKLYMPGTHNDSREITRFAKSVAVDQRLEEFYDVQWV